MGGEKATAIGAPTPFCGFVALPRVANQRAHRPFSSEGAGRSQIVLGWGGKNGEVENARVRRTAQ